jgi:hypothetical protein
MSCSTLGRVEKTPTVLEPFLYFDHTVARRLSMPNVAFAQVGLGLDRGKESPGRQRIVRAPPSGRRPIGLAALP